MPVNKERLRHLLYRNIAKQCSKEEIEELYHLLSGIDRGYVEQLLDELYHETNSIQVQDHVVDWESMLTNILREPQELRVSYKQRYFSIKRLMIAASILLVMGMIGYQMFTVSVKKDFTDIIGKKDILAPSANRSSITLDDGTIIPLDSLDNGTFGRNGLVQIVKESNGQITYRPTGKHDDELKYNKVNNPKGSKVLDITLSDGSRVWLNAGSSIRFPLCFVGVDRNVEIEGEAYFEVSHQVNKRFKVKKGDVEVTVLGTKFNVKAYNDDAQISVTLVHGAVAVSKKKERKTLIPHQQATIEQEVIKVRSGVNIESVMAWKNGMFSFDGVTIQEVMKQIARWYDLDVIYEGNISKKGFGGKIFKEATLSEVMKILEFSGVHYEMKNQKTIIIKSE